MNPHQTARSLARALAPLPGLAGVRVYAHDLQVQADGAEIGPVTEIALPALFIKAKCESLASSAQIGRATVEIAVESNSDDETSEIHSGREQAVRAGMANLGALIVAFEAVGTVELLGRPALIENDPETEARAFRTPITYRLGVRER